MCRELSLRSEAILSPGERSERLERAKQTNDFCGRASCFFFFFFFLLLQFIVLVFAASVESEVSLSLLFRPSPSLLAPFLRLCFRSLAAGTYHVVHSLGGAHDGERRHFSSRGKKSGSEECICSSIDGRRSAVLFSLSLSVDLLSSPPLTSLLSLELFLSLSFSSAAHENGGKNNKTTKKSPSPRRRPLSGACSPLRPLSSTTARSSFPPSPAAPRCAAGSAGSSACML